jgi:hypothetical protein
MADNIYTSFIKDVNNIAFRGINYLEYSDKGTELFISFESLLKFISDNLNLVSNGEAIVKINYAEDKPFYALSCQISADITKFYIYNEKLKLEDGGNPVLRSGGTLANFHPFTHFYYDSDLTELNNKLLKEAQIPAGQEAKYAYPQVGNINYIYLNVGYLSQIIADNLDKENKITLRNFLQTICDDASRALGGINDFQVVINPDETPNVLTIIDVNQNRIKGLIKKYKNSQEYTIIQAQGIGPDNNTQGSFVRSLSAQSQITPEIASAISIGAQANGNQLGEEATSFSRLSKGLIDRVYPDKIIISDIGNSPTGSIDSRFTENLKAFSNLVNNLRPASTLPSSAKINSKISDVDNNGPIITDLFKAIVGEFTEKNQSNPTFIPIKLDIELLGIAGIKIFQQFELSSDVLPLSYQNDFNFIITGITHEVMTHKWITKLATLTYLKEKDLTVEQKAKIKPIQVLDVDFSSLTIAGVCKAYNYNTTYNKRPYSISLAQLNDSIKAWNITFKDINILTEEDGLCAKGVFNTALNLQNYFKFKETGRGNNEIKKKGNLLAAGGNAKDLSYSKALQGLKYTRSLVGEGLNKTQIQSAINSIEYNIGDILVYYSEDSSNSEGIYGHTQIYVGSQSTSGWSSDIKNNYGQSFVYNSKPSNCWTLYLYRVPNF